MIFSEIEIKFLKCTRKYDQILIASQEKLLCMDIFYI